jgi:hypothetical protein
MKQVRSWMILVAIPVAACSGALESISPPGQGLSEVDGKKGDKAYTPDPADPLPADVQALCVTPAVSPSPMRRLTHREYANAVRDLLAAEKTPELGLSHDTESGLFDTTANQLVSSLLADEYLDAASELAEGLDVSRLLGCDPAAASASCARDFIGNFGRRAYRRPLTADERTRLDTLYESTRAASDATTAVRAVVAATLASPHFLFRPEWGSEPAKIPDALRASPFELSTRLSFLLWSSLPDDELLDAAEADELSTDAQITAQAERMLSDPRAREATFDFYEQWLGLRALANSSKDRSIYPQFDDALRGAMREESKRFVEHVIWEDDAKLDTLLTAPYSFVNGPLAALYGVDAPSAPDSFAKVTFDDEPRRGVLTQASFLTAYASTDTSSPVKRGRWVRTRMFCQELPEPPPGIPALPDFKEGQSTRERLGAHTADEKCAGCHRKIDPIGFGLEEYDGIGAFRSEDHGKPVDAAGELLSTDVDGTFQGAVELSAMLASSAEVSDCAVSQWFRYSQGRREGKDDTCTLAVLQSSFRRGGGDLREFLVDLVKSDSFALYREPK